MSFTFIHTADWQLGKQFANIADDPRVVLREQRIKAVESVAQLALERRADAILVCGDVFDSNAVTDRTIRQALNATELFKGDWVFIPGNHDPALVESAWSRAQNILDGRNLKADNLHFLLKPEEPLFLKNGTLAILPAVLERRHEVDDLTAWFDAYETPPGVIRVGMAHGSVPELLPNSEAPNPVALSRDETAKLDYLALGDWHGTHRISERTWYSGTPEPDRFTSKDPGNALVVSISRAGAIPTVEKVRLGRYEWREEEIEVYSGEDLENLELQITAVVPNPQDTLLKLKLSGVLDLALHDRLRNVLDDWEARLRYLNLENGLTPKPSQDDLDRIDLSGFVRTAAERLGAQATESDSSEAKSAQEALLRLYRLHVQMGN